MDLDPSLEWRTATGMACGPLVALHCEGYEVARMCERITGGWFAVLRYTNGRRIHRDCMSFASGKAGCERWAMRHLSPLQDIGRRKHLELVANQPWRGEECHRARDALAQQSSQQVAPDRQGVPAALDGLACRPLQDSWWAPED